ncbi:MAG TPA: hypothetical protein PLI45_00920 [Candidatus Woesebacteria bacterium]|nr:hypothetical protein [Candidatus Woesebacteria bacterium]
MKSNSFMLESLNALLKEEYAAILSNRRGSVGNNLDREDYWRYATTMVYQRALAQMVIKEDQD